MSVRVGERERGVLSLVELVLITVILGILASASIVSYMGARDRAMIRQACGELNDVRQALSVYHTEFDTYPSGITSFGTLYTALSASGLEVDPSTVFSSFASFSSANLHYYTLAARAKDRGKTILTATPELIAAVTSSGDDYDEACNR